MHRGSSFFHASTPEIEHAPCTSLARLHMYVFAGQIDKKTPKHNTPGCSFSLCGSTHKNLEVIEKKATYLIYQYFQSVPICSLLSLEGEG